MRQRRRLNLRSCKVRFSGRDRLDFRGAIMVSCYTRTFVILMLVSFFAHATLAADAATKPAAAKTADFQSADKTFSFKYPADWDRTDNPTKNTVVKLEPKDVAQGHASFMLL